MNIWEETVRRWKSVWSVYGYGFMASISVRMLSKFLGGREIDRPDALEKSQAFFQRFLVAYDFFRGGTRNITDQELKDYAYVFRLLLSREGKKQLEFENSADSVKEFFDDMSETLGSALDPHHRSNVPALKIEKVRLFLDLMADDLLEASKAGFGIPEGHKLCA